jgi:glucose-6-phosphate isomerase
MLPSVAFRDTNAYKHLLKHFDVIRNKHMRELFANDADRFNKYSLQFDEILFDYSKNIIAEDTMRLLVQLAEEVQLAQAIEAMCSGEKINRTENRAVLHTALRNMGGVPVFCDGSDVMPLVKKELQHLQQFSDDVISGRWKGYTGMQIRDVVNIGIGGSDLGPVMVAEALKHYKIPHINVHYVSNVDGTHITETLKKLHPETTLFLIASKTFTTQETMTNAGTARRWFLDAAKDERHIAQHFAAMSTATDAVKQFGIAEANIFAFWDWVGGRYSMWSAIGLSVCLAIGFPNFEKLLAGAYAADVYFRQTPFSENIPVIMALLGFWYGEFFQFHTHAVIPYDQYLHRFAAYLQQTDMESNGKCVDRNGNPISYTTGPVIWGEPGTNGQHAFFQLMHQGTQIIPVDFIAPVNSLNPVGEHHSILLSNLFAQAEALMLGKTDTEVMAELQAKNYSDVEAAFHAPFRVFRGNRPSNMLLLDSLTPASLGKLIALYEHKIFVQGILWNVYSFDQWGVELGKKLAHIILPELKTEAPVNTHDSSTNGLINHYKQKRH